MKTHLLKLSILLFTVVAFSSCDNDDDPIAEKTYRLYSVAWYLEEGDGDVIVKKELPERVLTNTSDTKQIVSVGFQDVFERESSLFECKEKETLNKWVGEDFYISIPPFDHSLSSIRSYLTGDLKAPFCVGEESAVMPERILNSSIVLNPNQKLTLNASIEMKEVTATFVARFVEEGEQGNDSFEIKGKWTGKLLGEKHTSVHSIESI